MSIRNIFTLVLLHNVLSLGRCFISSFSSPVIFIYSIIRTIDGMEENIKHISNSMDLSLQNFLSNHVFNQKNEALFKPLTIGADYHGTISPYAFNFKHTLYNCRFSKEFIYNINSKINITLVEYQNTTLFTIQNNTFDIEAADLLSANTCERGQREILRRMQELGILDKHSDEKDPYYNHSQMVETAFIEGKGYLKNTDLVNMSTVTITQMGKEMNDMALSSPFSLKYFEEERLTNNLFKSSIYDSSGGGINIDEFKYHTYYVSHYINQIVNIVTMGISLRFLYIHKSVRRKLQLVK